MKRYATAPRYRKRHDNRKRYLRDQLRAGKITPDEYVELRTESLERCRAERLLDDPRSDTWQVLHDETVARGEHHINRHEAPGSDGWCVPECVGAVGQDCRCYCGGVNHAAWRGDHAKRVTGIDPLPTPEQVAALNMIRPVCLEYRAACDEYDLLRRRLRRMFTALVRSGVSAVSAAVIARQPPGSGQWLLLDGGTTLGVPPLAEVRAVGQALNQSKLRRRSARTSMVIAAKTTDGILTGVEIARLAGVHSQTVTGHWRRGCETHKPTRR